MALKSKKLSLGPENGTEKRKKRRGGSKGSVANESGMRSN